MSHDISLIPADGEELVVPEDELIAHYGKLSETEWGRPEFEGSFNVTYNYSDIYRLFDWHIKDLDGKQANDEVNLERMRAIVDKCGTKVYCTLDMSPANNNGWPSYRTKYDGWVPTPGNAGFRLKTLLIWAEANPTATWMF